MRASCPVFLLAALALLAWTTGCAAPEESGMPDNAPPTLRVASTAFEHGSAIPARHTCDGENVSPPLSLSQVPAGAQSLVLIMDDPDAPRGTWTHWVVWNVPPTTSELPENVDASTLGATEGGTSFPAPGYGGPCPPSGVHRYFFRVYALDASLDLPRGAGLGALRDAMRDRVLAEGELMGTYTRA